jgi:hypothetical protein
MDRRGRCGGLLKALRLHTANAEGAETGRDQSGAEAQCSRSIAQFGTPLARREKRPGVGVYDKIVEALTAC